MKKYFLLFVILLLYKNALGVPSNTLSITPVAVDATAITASDENTRNNGVVSTYNAHDHTDISQTNNTLNVGDGLAGNKTITANNVDSNKPYIRYDDTNNYWIFSTDGVAPSVVLQGTGITLEGTTDNAFETTLSITDPTADRTITIPNNTGTIPLSGASVAQTLTFSGDTISNLGTVTTADINGGTIDGATIGGSTAGAGTFSSLTATADLDIGTYELRANTFESDVATGTAPLTIASTTKVTNLNADTVDGYEGGTGVPSNIQVFTSSDTWTKPAGISTVYVKVWGGGGGGGAGGTSQGGGGGGGGAGGYSEGLISVTGNVTVTVGTENGTSSFAGSTTIQATGGVDGGAGTDSGGGAVAGGIGGAGGVGSVGTINLTGATGDAGNFGTGAANTAGAGGMGAGEYGGGGARGGSTSTAGSNGQQPGGGGGGGSNGGAGGTGGSGLVIVYY